MSNIINRHIIPGHCSGISNLLVNNSRNKCGNFLLMFLSYCVLLFFFFTCTPKETISSESIWPEITKEHKPWTRWWWMGSAVTKSGIEAQLIAFSKAGFGGVEITPIYGVKDYEGQYIDFLSDEWMQLLQFTIEKADELGMGVDMNLGTGWPFGGPQITPEYASSRLLTETYSLIEGEKLIEKVVSKDPRQNPKDVKLLALMAYFADGTSMELEGFLDDENKLSWLPEQDCEIVAAFNGKTRQKVKRAAPGGAGWTLNHFSEEAFKVYVSRFDSAFNQISNRPRAFFNDSYEVYGSSGTAEIFEEFKLRRGYDLKSYLRELISPEDTEINRRIQADYRQTFAELLMDEFTKPWVSWSNNQNVLTKNQAHGSPANIIDLYAAVDIPECETFGSSYFPIPGLRRDSTDVRPVDPDPVMLKFATSAANIYGKKQVSSETFTWLAEHFRTSLSQCKPELEQVFLSGVNHVFYHGTTYSPPEAEWPGWLFYASVQFGPVNSFWPHVNGLNEYIARCQSILQGGHADNDVLVYWPYHDTRDKVGRLDQQISVHNIDEWLHPTPFYKLSTDLMDHGYLVDFATDKVVEDLSFIDGRLQANENGGRYKTIIVPDCNIMPLETLWKLQSLISDGATVFFLDWPNDVPGFYDFERRKSELINEIEGIQFDESAGISRFRKGMMILTDDIKDALKENNIVGETLTASGLQFVRRRIDDDIYYYLVNHTARSVDESLYIKSAKRHAMLMDPDQGSFGKIALKKSERKSKIRVQLYSGQTIIVRCTDLDVSQIPDWKYIDKDAQSIPVDQPWKLSFSHGGPELPESIELDDLVSWTELGDEKAQYFSGQGVYKNEFLVGGELADEYILDLGKVTESARVWINDEEVGVLWGIPFKVRIGHYVKKGQNSIKIEVANLMANRIRYMDQQGIEWRKFHEINFVNIDYEPFDASDWEPMASGLLGPVVLKSMDCK